MLIFEVHFCIVCVRARAQLDASREDFQMSDLFINKKKTTLKP